jgi:hypothetical protein
VKRDGASWTQAAAARWAGQGAMMRQVMERRRASGPRALSKRGQPGAKAGRRGDWRQKHLAPPAWQMQLA